MVMVGIIAVVYLYWLYLLFSGVDR